MAVGHGIVTSVVCGFFCGNRLHEAEVLERGKAIQRKYMEEMEGKTHEARAAHRAKLQAEQAERQARAKKW